MDDKTFNNAVGEAARLNNLSIEKLANELRMTNVLLFFVALSFPLSLWLNNIDFLHRLVTAFGWMLVLLVLSLILGGAMYIIAKKEK